MVQNPLLRAFLRGAALPGMIVATCAAIGFILDIIQKEPPLADINSFKLGIGVGLFFSLWGGLEIMAAIMMSSEVPMEFRCMRVLGYMTVWVSCIFIILKSWPS